MTKRTCPDSDEQFEALHREASFASVMMGRGITALAAAGYAQPAHYIEAFFALSVGLERAAKLAVIVAHALEHDGEFPPEGSIRALGHDLNRSLSLLDTMTAEGQFGPDVGRLPCSPIHAGVVAVLTAFAQNVTRYYNIDAALGTPRDPNVSEPIADWYGRVVEPVLAIHYNARARAQHGALAEFAEAVLGSRMFVRQVGQTGSSITTMADATTQAAIDRYVERYVRMYVLQIIRFVARVLSHLGSAAQAKGLQEIPYLDEYFYLFRCDDAEMKSRKTWSFYRP